MTLTLVTVDTCWIFTLYFEWFVQRIASPLLLRGSKRREGRAMAESMAEASASQTHITLWAGQMKQGEHVNMSMVERCI